VVENVPPAVCGDPAVVVTVSVAAEAGPTVIEGVVPVIVPSTVSVAVIVRLPAVFNVVPLVNVCVLTPRVSTATRYPPRIATMSANTVRTGSMSTARLGHTATLLNDGRVLVAGGTQGRGGNLASAELYNPSTGTFAPTGSMNTTRELFTATLLSTGEVLAAAGENTNAIAPFLTSAELYNPATGKWSPTGSLNTGRYNHTATLLSNGQVLIVGGGAHLASTELYNPSRGKFSNAANLNTGRTDHSTVLLTNGDALTMGGYDGSGGNIGYLSSAELFP